MATAGPVFTTATSTFETVTVQTAVSFFSLGSCVVADTVAMLVYCVPETASAGTWPVSVSTAVAPAGNEAAEHERVPPEPTAGVVHDSAGPLVCSTATKVMSPGNVSCRVSAAAASGPPLVTVKVKTTSSSGRALAGPDLATPMAAVGGGGVIVTATAVLFSSLGSNVELVTVAWLVKTM